MQYFVVDDVCDQNVVVLFGVMKKVEMFDVKQVESINGIVDMCFYDFFRLVIFQ